MNVTRKGNVEIIDMTTLEQIDDILKRLYQIENCLLQFTPIIDIAYEYEDRLKAIESKLEPKDKPMTTDNEKLENVKNLLLQKISNQYGDLIQTVIKLPINATLLNHAILNFDQGYLWIKEGILKAEITLAPPQGENQDGESQGNGNEESSEKSACEKGSEQSAKGESEQNA